MKRINLFAAVFSAILLLTAAGCAPTPTREGTGEYVEDSWITGKVKAALVAEPGLKAHQINVETFKGTVQLSGFVTTADEKRRASDLARQIKGVQKVDNDIRLR